MYILLPSIILSQMFERVNIEQNILVSIDQLHLNAFFSLFCWFNKRPLLVCPFYLRARPKHHSVSYFISRAEPQCPLALQNYFSNQSMLVSQANTWLLNGSLPLWPSYPRVILREISFPDWIYDMLLPQRNTNSLNLSFLAAHSSIL